MPLEKPPTLSALHRCLLKRFQLLLPHLTRTTSNFWNLGAVLPLLRRQEVHAQHVVGLKRVRKVGASGEGIYPPLILGLGCQLCEMYRTRCQVPIGRCSAGRHHGPRPGHLRSAGMCWWIRCRTGPVDQFQGAGPWPDGHFQKGPSHLQSCNLAIRDPSMIVY